MTTIDEIAEIISDYLSNNGFEVVSADYMADVVNGVRWLTFNVVTREILDAAPSDMSFIYGSAPKLRVYKDGGVSVVCHINTNGCMDSFVKHLDIEDPEFFSKLKSYIESDRMFTDPDLFLEQ